MRQPGDLPLPPQVRRNIASSSRKHALTPPSPAVHRGLFWVLWALHVTVAVLSSDGTLPCKQAPPWLEAFLAGQVDQGELLLYCPGGQVIQHPPWTPEPAPQASRAPSANLGLEVRQPALEKLPALTVAALSSSQGLVPRLAASASPRSLSTNAESQAHPRPCTSEFASLTGPWGIEYPLKFEIHKQPPSQAQSGIFSWEGLGAGQPPVSPPVTTPSQPSRPDQGP